MHGIRVEVPLGYEALVFSVFGRRCAACGATRGVELDHHTPLAAGHALLHNAVPLCKSCNARKGNSLPGEFYDGWKLTEIAILLLETREAFEQRFGDGASAC